MYGSQFDTCPGIYIITNTYIIEQGTHIYGSQSDTCPGLRVHVAGHRQQAIRPFDVVLKKVSDMKALSIERGERERF